jgi:hypothetical protein
MPDLSAALPTTEPEEVFLRIVDVEGKLTAALEDLGPVAGRDVVLLDADGGYRLRQLAEIGARVTPVVFPDARDEEAALVIMANLPAAEADAVVVPWSEMATPGSAFITAAERLLRPGGKLLLIHDYGRDDVWNLRPDLRDRQVAWSQRRGPFLGVGFRVRVLHCWWTFESMEEARELLEAAFGENGVTVADRMKRPRLEYQVAVYHRAMAAAGGDGDAAEALEVGGTAG